ncbi:hypothetical protein [Marinobacter sp. VGCF2001]|uniref:hypothetical protein n=1 Tax=Marinobacter sp. VGCF2001 TaxID=3417189 RepID=UPI003CF78417
MTAYKTIRKYLWPALVFLAVFQLQPVSASQGEQASAREYILWYRNYDNPAVRALVELALHKTPEFDDFRIVRSAVISQGRALRELANPRRKLLDIANMATSAERESYVKAIPVPLDGGLLGFRVCLTLPEHLALFDGVETLEDFRQRNIRIGQGSHWPDTEILKANGIGVVTHARYEILFGMLRNQRFECFARSVSEVLFDIEHNNAEDLVIEPDLLLAYPMPSYLFVARGDHETAQRLRLGLERAIADGSFAVYLDTWFGKAVSELGLDQRTILTLANPYLSEESRHIGRKALENLIRLRNTLEQSQ